MRTHRLIPSRFPPVLLFDWATSTSRLEEIALIEGLTNDRLQEEIGNISLVPKADRIVGPGSTPLMSAFTHPGPSRFTAGQFGIYYAGDTLETAIAETVYHKELLLRASKEAPSQHQMREYITHVQKPLEQLSRREHLHLLNPDHLAYGPSQIFGAAKRAENIWGLHYPSVRKENATCVAIFRPPALSIPIQGCHLEYIWDGKKISDVRKLVSISY